VAGWLETLPQQERLEPVGDGLVAVGPDQRRAMYGTGAALVKLFFSRLQDFSFIMVTKIFYHLNHQRHTRILSVFFWWIRSRFTCFQRAAIVNCYLAYMFRGLVPDTVKHPGCRPWASTTLFLRAHRLRCISSDVREAYK